MTTQPYTEYNIRVQIKHAKSLPPIKKGDEIEVQGLAKWLIQVRSVLKVEPFDEEHDTYTVKANRTYVS